MGITRTNITKNVYLKFNKGINMIITPAQVSKILTVMETFPEAEFFKLEQSNGGAIGTYLNLIISTRVNGINGKFVTEISGVESW